MAYNLVYLVEKSDSILILTQAQVLFYFGKNFRKLGEFFLDIWAFD